MRPLAGYVADLADRLRFILAWDFSGPPVAFWLPGLFCLRCFLSAVQQTFARKHGLSLDDLELDFRILSAEPTEACDDGAYGKGLYLEACKWDPERCELHEPEDQVVVTASPSIWI